MMEESVALSGESHRPWLDQNGFHDANNNATDRIQLGGARSPRLVYWLTYFLITIITMGSSMEALDAESSKSSGKQTWVITCSLLSFFCTGSVVLMHSSMRFSLLIMDTKLEGFLICILLASWIGSVSIVSDAENGLAVNEEGVVIYGNLYYFSWGGLVCAVMLFVSYLQSIFYVNVLGEYRARSPRLFQWSAFLMFSLIVMGSGSSIYDINCRVNNANRKFCKRTKLAVMVGILGALCATLIVGMKFATGRAPFSLEFSFSVTLFLMYAFAVAYITSEKGPGAPLGNLYYSLWASFILMFLICIGNYESFQARQARKQMEEQEQIRREIMESEPKEELSKADYDDEENLFVNYDDDYNTNERMSMNFDAKSYSGNSRSIPLDDDNNDALENDGRSLRSSYTSRSVPLDVDDNDISVDGRSIRSTNIDMDARSSRSHVSRSVPLDDNDDDTRSVRSGYTHASRSVPLDDNDEDLSYYGRSVRSLNIDDDARSVRSGYALASRSVPLDYVVEEDNDDDGRSVRSGHSLGSRFVTSNNEKFHQGDSFRSIPEDTSIDSQDVRTEDISITDSHIKVGGVNTNSQSKRSLLGSRRSNRSINSNTDVMTNLVHQPSSRSTTRNSSVTRAVDFDAQSIQSRLSERDMDLDAQSVQSGYTSRSTRSALSSHSRSRHSDVQSVSSLRNTTGSRSVPLDDDDFDARLEAQSITSGSSNYDVVTNDNDDDDESKENDH